MKYILIALTCFAFSFVIMAEEKAKDEATKEKVITGEDLVKIIKKYQEMVEKYNDKKGNEKESLGKKIIEFREKTIADLNGKKITGTLDKKENITDKRICWYSEFKIKSKKHNKVNDSANIRAKVIQQFNTKEDAGESNNTFSGYIKKVEMSASNSYGESKYLTVVIEYTVDTK